MTPQGKVKAKGSYGYDQNDLGRKATDRIVVDAVREYFINNVPLVDTVRGRADIKAFINYFRAPKGSVIVDVNGHDLGSIARWYIGTNGVRLNKQKLVDGKLTQLVEAGAVVLPDLPAAFPEDVDADHYVGAAEALVQAITEPGLRQPTTIPIAELSKAQRGVLEASKVAPADLGRCILLDLERYHADWAAVSAGNSHDTMKVLLCRLWMAEQGKLTAGDLLWVAAQLDEGGGVCPEAERRRLVDWIVRHVSPFPLPKTVEEHVARAMEWARDTVPPVTRKRKQPLVHTGVIGSDFVSDFVKRVALDHYRKHRKIYKLACSIAAVSVRNASGLSEPAICAIIAEVDAFLDAEPVIVGETAEPEGKTAAVAPDDPPPTGWRPVAYDPLGVEAPPDEPVTAPGTPAATPPVVTTPNNAPAFQHPHPLLTLSAFMDMFTAPDYIVDGIIQRGRLHALTSRTGHGKTAVALFLACLVAAGRNLGYIEVTQGAVVFLAGENPDDVCGRCWAACQHYGLDPDQTPIFVMPGNFPLDADAAEALTQKLNDLGIPITLIFGDSASAYFPGENEIDNVEMGGFARTVRTLIDGCNGKPGVNGRPGVVMLCHPVKNAAKDNLLPRGGGQFLNELDANLTLWGGAGQIETTALHWQGKIRGANFQPVDFGLTPVQLKDKVDAKGRHFMSIVATLLTDAQVETIRQQTTTDARTVLEYLRAYPGISIADIARGAGWVSTPTTDKPPVPNKAKVHRALETLETHKLAKKSFGGWAITDAGTCELTGKTPRKRPKDDDETLRPEDLADFSQ